jgi:hypothetical protein
MQRDTLDAIANRLEPGGLFNLATDILAYAEMSAELLSSTPGVDNTLGSPWSSSLPGRFVTKYEAKARREGRACCYFAYRRNNAPPPQIPTIKELDMPHLVFTSPLSPDEMLAPFERREHAEDDMHIAFLYGYRGEHSVLFEVYVKEPTIDQRVALMLVEREEAHQYTLQLGMLGHPRPTPGIHLAVRLLGDWLTSLHPEARILKAKLQD